MTGNTKVWRAPLAGLASLAMIATMGVAAGTANAAFKLNTEAAKYTVTLDADSKNGTLGSALIAKLKSVDANGTFNDKDDKNETDVVLNNSKQDKATVATISNVTADTKLSDLVSAPQSVDSKSRTFVYWTVNGVAADTTDGKVTGNLDLKARYAVGTDSLVTVTFKGADKNASVSLVKGDKLAAWQVGSTADTNPQQVAGWATSVNGNAVDPTAAAVTKNINYVPVYAKTVKVTFHLNGGTESGEDGAVTDGYSKYVVASKGFDAPDKKVAPTMAGKAFSGWYTLKANKTDATNYENLSDAAFDFTKGTDNDVDLYAKYGEQAITSTANFFFTTKQKADGTVETLPSNPSAEAQKSFLYGSDDSVANNTQLAKPADPTDNTDAGRPFAFWSKYQNATYKDTDKAYNWSTYIKGKQTVNLFAVFGEPTKSSKKITLDENWQDGSRTEVNANADGKVTFPSPAKRDGYNFLNWKNAVGETVKAGDSKTVDDGDTYYAQWEDAAFAGYDTLKVKLDNSKQFYDAKTYDAYSKVYDKYFIANSVASEPGTAKFDEKNDKDKKIEAAKAVKAAQDAIVEKSTSALYRLYNNGNGDHYFTANEVQAGALKTLGWNYEGAPYRVVSIKSQDVDRSANKQFRPLGIAVWSVYNPNTGEHLLVQEYEADALAKAGWNKEQIQFYTPQGAKTEVYRVYNPNTTGPAHVYVSKSEATGLVKAGWRWDFGGKVAYKLG